MEFNVSNIITGATFGRYFVGPVQLAVCYGAVVGLIILGGQCMKVYNCSSVFLNNFFSVLT